MDQSPSTDQHLLFSDLLAHLRKHGFTIGVDSYLRLQRLLDKVSGHCSPQDLKTLLCPLFATDKKQQEFFYRAFDEYLELSRVEEPASAIQEAAAPQTKQEPEKEPFWAQPWPYVALGMLLALVIALSAYYREKRVQVITGDPTPTPTTTPVNVQTPEPLPPTYIEEPSPEVVTALRWLAIFGPPIFLLLYEWYLYNQRKLLLKRLRSDTQPHILPLRPDPPRRKLFDSAQFYNAARLLRLRQQTEFYRLDIEATIGATIRELGFPTFRYKRSTKVPEYLALIERTSQRDHQSRLFEELVLSLEDQGVIVERYYFSHDPRVCFKHSHSGADRLPPTEAERRKFESGVNLQDLLSDDDQHRLLIFSSGESLVDPISGEMQAWTKIITRWNERAVLTPTSPADWGGRELTLSKNLIVVPATIEGLQSLVDYFELGEVESLRRWIKKESASPPKDFDSQEVVKQLRQYLGRDTFQWLCACAVYPRLQWDLTLYIGALPCMSPELIGDENLLRLIRLPWFQTSLIPENIRRLLVRELDPEIDSAVRAALVGLLDESTQKPLAATQHPLNIAVPESFVEEHRESFDKLLRALPSRRVIRDYTLAKYLESKPNRFLDLVLPRTLLQLFYPHGNTALQMRRSVRVILMLAIMLGAWLAAPRITHAFKTRQRATEQPQPTPELTPSPVPSVTPVSPSPSPIASPIASPVASPRVSPNASPSPRSTTTVIPSDCPILRLLSSEEIEYGPDADTQKIVDFQAGLTGGRVPKEVSYIWSISKGQIIRGQGTSQISVALSGFKDGESFTTNVRVNGLNALCQSTLAVSSVVHFTKGSPTPVPTPAAPGSPQRFYFIYDFGEAGEKGRHDWVRIDNNTWVERFPNGFENRIRAAGRINVEGDSGTLLILVRDPSLQYFIPDKGSRLMWLRDRREGADWGFLGEMKDIQ
jgi:hypothetical protein